LQEPPHFLQSLQERCPPRCRRRAEVVGEVAAAALAEHRHR
jgi:hypothetical protein